MTCEYCRHLTNSPLNEELPGLDDDDIEYGKELHAMIYGTDGARPCIAVYQEGTSNALFIDISFCPVCGRDLRRG